MMHKLFHHDHHDKQQPAPVPTAYPATSYASPAGYPVQPQMGSSGGYTQPQPGAYQPGTYAQPQMGSSGGYAQSQPGPYAQPQMVSPGGYAQPQMFQPAGGMPGSLNVLMNFPTIFISQKKELFEIVTGFQTENRYAVLGPNKEPLFFCREQSSTLSRLVLGGDGPFRKFNMEISDAAGNVVLLLEKPFTVAKKHINVADAQGVPIGTVLKKISPLKTVMELNNPSGQKLFKLDGGTPIHPWTFKIYDLNKREVGVIYKKFSGVMQELFTTADDFECTFPPEANLQCRILMLVATIFVDYARFEERR